MKNQCNKCGKEFYRISKEGKKQFQQRKFCSLACSSSYSKTTHGFTPKTGWHRFYKIWTKIQERTKNPNSKSNGWKCYFGIKNYWKSFEEFKNDMYESYEAHIQKFCHRQLANRNLRCHQPKQLAHFLKVYLTYLKFKF